MFKKILVPLDGSKLAECALSYAEELALMSKADKLTLISVTEKLKGVFFSSEGQHALEASGDPGLGVSRDRSANSFFGNAVASYPIPVLPDQYTNQGGVSIIIGKMKKQAQKYLDRIAERFEKKNIPVSTEVLIGNVAEEITSYADENGYDVIVMSSHGRSGPSRWTYGSVTDKVFRSACIPLLVVRAPGCFPELEKKTARKKK
jgi:nucleotide-binding universal stress UspA family protein